MLEDTSDDVFEDGQEAAEAEADVFEDGQEAAEAEAAAAAGRDRPDF